MSLFVQAQLVQRLPDISLRVRHRHMGHTMMSECVDDGVGECRDAADVRRFPDALGADRVMRTGSYREVRFPLRRFNRSRQEIIHQTGAENVAGFVVDDLLSHRDGEPSHRL